MRQKLSGKQQKELCRMNEVGQYSISDLAELFSISRPTAYRTLSRGNGRKDILFAAIVLNID
ncbi:hypothetical protein KB20921_32610 [Edwardsiella ictaluri]|uniref:Resolvase HTH domain-containing protein n=1 Tax=Edwardsiella ictaluri (strain 93-146) TaxID=634503 RepID=C5B977_EDWI9|nr:hypothetical protein NT01EI_3689 [Edwardsiella ictaluri 93-146]BEI00524.1 hypothetical protein KH20906_32510 [Edwardsiella ictaluri]BEI04000.1 hypothetical protein KB20921_32610 [Edwardsiella ictaluri]BEI07455.1 hypothetical protein KH201010_32410 [Edwardsiella ictaluri]BEI10927.1 hypothetical protein STU22726_32580 [Edwardsiella ictaluri]